MKRFNFIKVLLTLPLISLFSFKSKNSIVEYIKTRGFNVKWEDEERIFLTNKPVGTYKLPLSMPQDIVRYSYTVFVYKKYPRILVKKDQGYYAQLGGIFDGKVDNIDDLHIIFKCLGL